MTKLVGVNATHWKGGITIDKSGYILRHEPNHPFSNSAGYVREHRVIMEREIGRFLAANEIVHHKDGNKSNNSIANLELTNRNDHQRKYHRDMLLTNLPNRR